MTSWVRSKVRVDRYTHSDYSLGYVQSSPIDYRMVLPYTRRRYINVGVPARSWSTSPSWNLVSTLYKSTGGFNQAYERLYSSASGGGRAMLGVTIAESTKALSMIANRARSIAHILTLLQTIRNPGNATRLYKTVLEGEYGSKVDKTRTRRFRKSQNRRPSEANAWLELQFGILPLIKDVYDACAVLGQSPKSEKCQGTGFEQDAYYDYQTFKGGFSREDATGSKILRLGGYVKTISPNALLFKQLGLINPMVVMWDLVPYSFVIDWFLPVGRFLKSLDLHVGIELERTFQSITINASGGDAYFARDPYGKVVRDEAHSSSGFLFVRSLWPGSKPRFADYVMPLNGSVWRAVTSVALVTQLRYSASRA